MKHNGSNRVFRISAGLLLLALGLSGLAGYGRQQPGPAVVTEPAGTAGEKATADQQQVKAPQAEARYVLPLEKRARAVAYSRAQYLIYFASLALSIGIYGLFWRAGFAVALRDWVRRVSRRRFVQSSLFAALFLAAVEVLELPLDYYGEFRLEHRFDLSTQGLGSWLADWTKNLGLTVLTGIILVWVFYWLVRRSPRRWWFYSWLASIPLTLGFILIGPYVVEPLFNRFTPLDKTQPVLAGRIEKMLSRGGLAIPRSHIYEMNASAKTRIVDAYVSGLGASKRMVVWDTLLNKLDSDETLLVLGHEAGHYVLHHIPKEFALIELLFLVLSYVGFVVVNGILGRAGARTSVEGAGDLASLPIMLLVLTVLVFAASPGINGISRHYEHQADQFGLEVAYGTVADPNAADIRAFQILGEEDLEDPDPNPFVRFWLYTHPPLDDRIRFAASYRPWAEGKPCEFVPLARD